MFYNKKRVLVTGGTGFIGRHFVEALIAQGAAVRVPVHERPLPDIFKSKVEVVSADLTRQEDCLSALNGMEYIFHAAGAVAAAAVTTSNPMAAITANLVLTAQVLQAAWTTKVDRVLIFSSSTGYPAVNHPVKEEEMWNGPTHASYFGYGWMRRYLERLGEYVASKSSVKVAIARPSAVYGRHDNFDPKTSHVIPALIRRAVIKENPFVVWGTGNDVRDSLHVTDLVRGCLLLLEKNPNADPINIAYGKGYSIKETIDIILKSAGHELADVRFDATKPSTIPFRTMDTSKAKQLLGFEPMISFEDGLRDTIAWFKDQTRS
ncbi:MAG TPA: NAD-dependent epimerase/dehydratase family protein [Nitrospirota bacterium]|nr:NAD-dependent epimerase/dehydratase family protein [Nitrospirota bacterium]